MASHGERELLPFLCTGLPLLGLLAFAYFADSTSRSRARDLFAKAKRRAERGDVSTALKLAREAAHALPTGKGGSATPESVEMLTFAAVLEERERHELRERRKAKREAAPHDDSADGIEPSEDAAPTPRGAPATELREGARVGEYALESPISEGATSAVWRARHVAFETPAALKISLVPGRAEGLRRMCRIQRRLEDPRIVRVLGADLQAEPPYVALELVDGEDLRRHLHARKKLAPGRALEVFEEIAFALAAAHEAGVVHRDLKPENILISKLGAVKVTDFDLGQATTSSLAGSGKGGRGPTLLRSTGLESVAAPEGVAGTLAYMAPEQLAGEDVDARADVYALGVILFEMLTGERPQPGDVPSRFIPGLPPRVDALFEGCYTRREKRHASARGVLDALRGAA